MTAAASSPEDSGTQEAMTGVWAVIEYIWDHVNVAVFPTQEAANEWIATQVPERDEHQQQLTAEWRQWGALT